MPDNVIPLLTHAPRTDTQSMRLVVERVEGTRLIGWAHDPVTPGQERIALHCGSILEAPLRRVPRADVQLALGGDAPLALGFEIELPTSIWRAMSDSGSGMQILVNDVAATQHPLVPTLKGLVGWMNRLGREADPLQRESLLAPLRIHLAEAQQWQGGPAGDADSVLEALPVARHLEGWHGLLLAGWVADEPRQREPIRLRCAGMLLDCMVSRTSRKDVATALALEHDEVGFELEVPGSLWRQFSGADELVLQVMVGSLPCGEPLRLRRDELSDRLDQALAMTDPGRRSHQGLLAMEHLVLAGELGGLDHALRTALQVLADSAGVGDWLDPQGPAEVVSTVQQRAPTRLGPPGRVGRWLRRPSVAATALRLLEALRRRPGWSRQADSLELRLTRSLGLFDKALYEDQVPEHERDGMSALRHYVRYGDARSLVPMCLFDPRHYTGQLDGRRHPGINRLLHYGLSGRFQDLSPCGWFDASYYSEANRDVREAKLDPLVHFATWGWKERRRPHPHFEPTVGARQGLMQRLTRASAASHADPLVRYLLEGLPPDAALPEPGHLPWMTSTRLDGRDYLDLAPWRTLPARPPAPVLDVIVPIYAGAQETLRCLWSVLSAPVEMPFELVAIDDCSPDPALSACLRELAALG
ncbi:MAG TPA: hypothetical protein VLA16_26570, partial [Ideonella sp.]|nr:hypothetical protein [Ideonella sp.]